MRLNQNDDQVFMKLSASAKPMSAHDLLDALRGDSVAPAKADIVIINDLGLEEWLAPMGQASSTKARRVTTSNGIAPLKLEEEGQQVADPHAWQNPANGLIYARNVADGLYEVDVEDCVAFGKNVETYGKEINALDDGLHTRFVKIQEGRRQLIRHNAERLIAAMAGS